MHLPKMKFKNLIIKDLTRPRMEVMERKDEEGHLFPGPCLMSAVEFTVPDLDRNNRNEIVGRYDILELTCLEDHREKWRFYHVAAMLSADKTKDDINRFTMTYDRCERF